MKDRELIARRLRVLMLIPHLGVGGAQGAFLRLAEFLAGEADVTIALMTRSDKENSTVDIPLVSLINQRAEGRIKRWCAMFMRLRTLKREHDVAISFLSGVNLLNALVGPRYKTIVSERGSKRNDVGMTNLQRILWTRVLDPLIYWRAGRVVAASEGLAYEIVSANPWAEDRAVAIEGAVRAVQLVNASDLPVEREFAWLADCETVVTFGRLHVTKGYDFLLQVFARVRAVRPRARLLLIGEGPEGFPLRAISNELGLSFGGPKDDVDVVFAGEKSDPVRYARLGRVFVLPSRSEGLPNSLIEALAAGVPILASDCCWGPRSILSGGKIGYGNNCLKLPLEMKYGTLMPVLNAPDSLSIWKRELESVLASSKRRRDLSERLEAVAKYDIGTTGPSWLKLAQQLFGNEHIKHV